MGYTLPAKDMERSMLGVAILVLVLVPQIHGLICYDCSYDARTDSINNCVTVSSTDTSTRTCTGSASGNYYCETRLNINDGVTNYVERQCRIGNRPGTHECEAQIDESGNPTSYTECGIYCNTDRCNDENAIGLKRCSKDCSGNGQCDYITGTCLCNSGYQGIDCSATAPTSTPAPATPRKCYQCSTEYDGGCESVTGVEPADCLNGESYCSTTRTAIYDRDGEIVVKNVTTRGCTYNYVAVDECSFSNIYSDNPIYSVGYKEFTCYSTCDQDGCNSNTADGIINDDESVRLYCVQCSGTNDCTATRTLCPSDMTYCKSTVKYMINEKADLHYKEEEPNYLPLSIVRECANEPVEASCVEKNVEGAAALKKVTCTETCQEDGCNTGWPARPKCVRCSFTDSCIDSPGFPTDCPYPYHGYCFIFDEGIQQGINDAAKGYPRRLERGCSYYDRGTTCTSQTPRDTAIESCNRTCTTDGCNVGSGSVMPLQTLATVLLAAVTAQIFHV